MPSVVPFSSSLQSCPASGFFSNEWALCLRCPNWRFSFSISPSEEYSGLIFFRMDWLDLLAVQGTLKSLLQHHSWKASILWHSAFFTVQHSHTYMTTGKTIALTTGTKDYYYVYSLRQSQDPAPRLYYCLLPAPPLSLLSLPSLTSNCLNPPFGTQGSSWRLESIAHKQEMGDTESIHT